MAALWNCTFGLLRFMVLKRLEITFPYSWDKERGGNQKWQSQRSCWSLAQHWLPLLLSHVWGVCMNLLPCTWAALIFVSGSCPHFPLTFPCLGRAPETELPHDAPHSPSSACGRITARALSACSCAGQVSLNISISPPVASKHSLAPRPALPQFPHRQGSNLATPAPQSLWKL